MNKIPYKIIIALLLCVAILLTHCFLMDHSRQYLYFFTGIARKTRALTKLIFSKRYSSREAALAAVSAENERLEYEIIFEAEDYLYCDDPRCINGYFIIKKQAGWIAVPDYILRLAESPARGQSEDEIMISGKGFLLNTDIYTINGKTVHLFAGSAEPEVADNIAQNVEFPSTASLIVLRPDDKQTIYNLFSCTIYIYWVS